MIAALFILQTLRIAVPYLFASMGGVISERVGLIALSLEGYMLTGAFCAAVGAYYSNNAWVGVLCGMGGGLLMAMIYAVATVKYRADQVVIGIAINLMAIGATRFFLRLAFDSAANSPRIGGFAVQQVGSGIIALLTNPLVWLAVVTIAGMHWLLYRTPFGLRVRAVGEHPAAAVSVGISVTRIQYIAAGLSGMIAGLGGVYLAIDQHKFTSEMTAGRGFIALAATIFGRWQPGRAAIACLFFAAAETLQIQLQGREIIPSQFIDMIPYLLTIIALAGIVGRVHPPAALGKARD
jgi:simple sugar transport system permease protein